jgi:hypothetical protein
MTIKRLRSVEEGEEQRETDGCGSGLICPLLVRLPNSTNKNCIENIHVKNHIIHQNKIKAPIFYLATLAPVAQKYLEI